MAFLPNSLPTPLHRARSICIQEDQPADFGTRAQFHEMNPATPKMPAVGPSRIWNKH
jgi:hypothetical protein